MPSVSSYCILAITMSGNLNPDLPVLKEIFLQHGYSRSEVNRVFYRKGRKPARQDNDEGIKGAAVVPFCVSVTNRITWLLRHKNLRTVTCPVQKIKDLMGSVEDPLGLWVPVGYQIPCSCGKSYIAQTGRAVTIREQEHKWPLKMGNIEKSAIAQHKPQDSVWKY